MKLLQEFSHRYIPTATCSESTLDMYQRRLRFFARRLPEAGFDDITTADLNRIRREAKAEGLSPKTIENSINDLMHVLGRVGIEIDKGSPLRIPPPKPKIRTLDDFDALLRRLPPFWRAWCAVAYVTGLRKSDVYRVTIGEDETEIHLTAGKTEKTQRYPIPPWLRRAVTPFFGQSFARNDATLYDIFGRASKAAGVARWSPQQIRILSANQWEKAQTGLGPLILGQSLPGWSKSTVYYLDPCEPLFKHVDSLAIPEFLKDESDRDQAIWRERRFRQLLKQMSERDQESVLSIAEKFAS